MNQHLHYSQQDKENQFDDSNGARDHENELKKKLFDNLKKAGVLDGIKSSMRVRLYEQLKLQNEKSCLNFRDQSNRLTFKIAVSMVADLFQKCDMPYAMSVFLPECGIQQEILSKAELIEVLSLHKDEHYQSATAKAGLTTPLLLDIVDILKQQGSVRPHAVSCSIQTEEAGEAAMTLDQKLRKIDYKQMEKSDTERLLPFKTLEERMLKYKRECEIKYKEDLDSEIRRMKEFELSKLRMDEAQKYRLKLQEYRDELEQLQQDKLRELKLRESEMLERIKNRERDLDKMSFEVRQKQLKDEEVLRSRENELKKTMEMEHMMLRTEKDLLQKTQKDYEIKVKEMETLRVRLQKEHIEEIERYKSELQRSYSDHDFDIHRRKMQLEEDEQRLKYDKERYALIENKNASMIQELKQNSEELRTLKKEHQQFFKDNHDMKEQLRVLNENLRRETEVCISRDKENKLLMQENQLLKSMLDDTKNQSNQYKDDQNQLIENLRLQLNETREMVVKLRENKDKEFKKLKERYEDERRRESEQMQFEYDKIRSEVAILQKRLGQEEHFSKELAIINNKLQNNNMKTSTYEVTNTEYSKTREIYTGKMAPQSFYPLSGADDDKDENEEILKRKKAWAELEREQEEVKRNIKSLMKTTPETRVIDDPMLADRVRGVRYEPQKYEYEEHVYQDKKTSNLKQQMKKEEKPKTVESPKKKEQPPVQQQQQQQHSSQKRQWKAENATTTTKTTTTTTNTTKQSQPEPKKDTTPQKSKEEEKKSSSYSSYPSTNTANRYDQPSSTQQKTPTTTYEQPKNTTSSLYSQPLNTTSPTPQNNNTSAQNSAQKKGAFKGASFNPFMKRDSPATAQETTPKLSTATNAYNQPSYQQQPANIWSPTTPNTFNMTQPPANKTNPLRRSTEKSEDHISDNIVDEYEEDFEVEDTTKKNTKANANNVFLYGNNTQQQEESSGGYSEQAFDDDMF